MCYGLPELTTFTCQSNCWISHQWVIEFSLIATLSIIMLFSVTDLILMTATIVVWWKLPWFSSTKYEINVVWKTILHLGIMDYCTGQQIKLQYTQYTYQDCYTSFASQSATWLLSMAEMLLYTTALMKCISCSSICQMYTFTQIIDLQIKLKKPNTNEQNITWWTDKWRNPKLT